MRKVVCGALIGAGLLVAAVVDRAARASLLPYCEPMQSRDPQPEFQTGLCPDSLDRTPSWQKPISTAPPLSMSDAIRIAHEQVRTLNPEIQEWELLEVGLHNTRVEHKWYYTVRWRPTRWRTQDDPKTRTIGVLMDGRVL